MILLPTTATTPSTYCGGKNGPLGFNCAINVPNDVNKTINKQPRIA
jgi:hypothetical protein